jgi:two-component system LytT family response regulator
MLKILIVDDEEAAGTILKTLIEKHVRMPAEIMICNNPEQAPGIIASFAPELLMLDIEMPVMSGFDLLSRTGTQGMDIVFTTAYDQYAVKAIRFSALDYLLKPIDIMDLQNAINRHVVRRLETPDSPALVSNLLRNLRQPANDFRLALSTGEGAFLFDPKDIMRIEGSNNYSRFFFVNHPSLLVSHTIKEYEDLLTEYNFLRVHKSHLVNRTYIRQIDRDYILWLTDGSQVAVSRRRMDVISQALKNKA